MATRKKSKRAPRKATRRARKARTSRKPASPRAARRATKRSKRKATRRVTRKRGAARGTARIAGAAMPAKPIKFIDTTAAPRCRSRIPVEVDIAGRRERGAIADMSASGARIVGIHVDLAPGTPLQIRYGSSTAPVLLTAKLVRSTDDGFAVRILPKPE